MDVVTLQEFARRGEPDVLLGLGAFDGVNRVHRAFLRELASLARERGALAAVCVIDGGVHRGARVLSGVESRLAQIAELGGVAIATTVSEAIYDRPATVLEEILTQVRPVSLAPCLLVGAASPTAVFDEIELAEVTTRRGIVIEPLLDRLPGFDASTMGLYTTRSISRFLDEGHVALAARLLGRYFEMADVVQPGDQRGRLLGFPTVNLAVSERQVLPGDGVYAGVVIMENDEMWPAAISLGRRSTFYDAGTRLLEAHLIGFSGDLYGRRVRVAFTDFVRGQVQFDSVDALVGQLRRDVALVTELRPVASVVGSLHWGDDTA